MRISTFVRLPLLIVALANTLRAQPLPVVDENFSDSERLTQNPPGSLAWFVPTTAVGELQVRARSLTLVANDRDRSLRAYFPAITLRIGDTVTLLVDFSFSRTPPSLPDGLRTALCFTNGVAPRRTDGTATGAYQGYGNFTNPGTATGGTRLRKRAGPAAANATASLLEVTDGPSTITWATFGGASTGVSSPLQAGIPYTCTLRVTRIGADLCVVSSNLAGGVLPANNSVNENDTSGAFTTFDTVAIGAADTAAAGDFTITRVSIVHDRTTARLSNLSILTNLSSATDSFAMGYVVSGADTTNPKPLVIRAAGPSLGALGVPNTVEDPKLELFAGAAKTLENDNWGGSVSLTAALANVGAFAYTGPLSKDAAIATSLTSRDNSVKVSATGAGAVIAEIYDATPAAAFTATTPRLANVSVLKNLGTSLTVGFVVGGTGAKQILIRAIGPGLAQFGVPGTVVDPQLRLFSGANVIGANDNWSGIAPLTAAFTAVGAFALDAVSKDAALLFTLQPGNYTVEVSGVNNTTGVALVEVYEVP